MTLRQILLHRFERSALLCAKRFDRFSHAGQQRLRHLAAVAHGLAADQVVGLNRGRPFVDRQDARVAVVLRGAGLFDVTHAAVDLHAERGDLVADVGRKCLGNGSEQRGAFVGGLTRGFVRVARDDADGSVRDAALTMLRDIALDAFEGVDEAGSLAAVDVLSDARTLAQIVKTSLRESVSRRTLPYRRCRRISFPTMPAR